MWILRALDISSVEEILRPETGEPLDDLHKSAKHSDNAAMDILTTIDSDTLSSDDDFNYI